MIVTGVGHLNSAYAVSYIVDRLCSVEKFVCSEGTRNLASYIPSYFTRTRKCRGACVTRGWGKNFKEFEKNAHISRFQRPVQPQEVQKMLYTQGQGLRKEFGKFCIYFKILKTGSSPGSAKDLDTQGLRKEFLINLKTFAHNLRF